MVHISKHNEMRATGADTRKERRPKWILIHTDSEKAYDEMLLSSQWLCFHMHSIYIFFVNIPQIF
ncbi:unnamed protein product [Larinioides sclopetarius]|uniref:Uncharacterized protein n=1 Tax=Larinioides sclopetarius TaxID=280406 RepID=A0AAV2APM5_9ARAC